MSLDLELDHGAVLPGHLQVDVVVLRLYSLLQRHVDLGLHLLPHNHHCFLNVPSNSVTGVSVVFLYRTDL